MKKMIRKFLFGVMVFGLILSACSNTMDTMEEHEEDEQVPAAYQEKQNPFAGDAATITKGKLLYEASCAVCHGVDGTGNGPASASLDPPADDLTELVGTIEDNYLYYRIAEGGTLELHPSSMPAWKEKLSEEQIWQIIVYVQSFP